MRATDPPIDRCLQSVLSRLPAGDGRVITLQGTGTARHAATIDDPAAGHRLEISVEDGTWRVVLDGQPVRETSDLRAAAAAAVRAWNAG